MANSPYLIGEYGKLVTAIKNYDYYKGKLPMSCRNFEEEMRTLQRCGCPQCRDRYYRMERDYHDRGRRYYDEYNRAPSVLNYKPASYMAIDFAVSEKEIKMEAKTDPLEPKNYAVKLLVDQLKAQQTELKTKSNSIEADKKVVKMYQDSLKKKNVEKLAVENKIKELALALKKLGHKE